MTRTWFLQVQVKVGVAVYKVDRTGQDEKGQDGTGHFFLKLNSTDSRDAMYYWLLPTLLHHISRNVRFDFFLNTSCPVIYCI